MMREWQERMGPGADEAVRDFFARVIPLGGRPGDPERDIAPVVAFLLSDHAHFVTGQTIPIDGGYCKVS
jgi:2-hydroxycyclohexanecarboxyl-CoA dehydrogenase